MKTELLAPAKNIETAKAAIDAGADAVYIVTLVQDKKQETHWRIYQNL